MFDIDHNDRLALIAIVHLPFLVHGSGSRLIGGHEVGVETPEVQSGLDSILGYTSQFRDPEGASISNRCEGRDKSEIDIEACLWCGVSTACMNAGRTYLSEGAKVDFHSDVVSFMMRYGV